MTSTSTLTGVVAQTWDELPVPAEKATWSAALLPGSQLRVAKTDGGGSALLLAVSDTPPADDVFGLKTSHIEYQPHRQLTVTQAGTTVAGRFAVLECQDADPELNAYFLRVADALVDEAKGPDGVARFDAAVRSLFELFRSLSRAGTRSIQGLWSELLLIGYARDPAYLVQAWHSDPAELHDFAGDGWRLEVKSSSRSLREHEFSLDQLLFEPDGTVIASVLLTEDDAGSTVFDLLEGLSERLGPGALYQRAEAIVAASLGNAWRDAREVRYVVADALESVQLFPAHAIPRPPGAMPPEVRAVRFRASLAAVPALEATGVENQVFAALVPLEAA